jgi:hypothetical protein
MDRQRSIFAIDFVWPVGVADRFWSHVDKNGPVIHERLGPCWVWDRPSAGKNRDYGSFSISGRIKSPAHRFSWLLHGNDIPAGVDVMHRCDNPACVRRSHLRLGTRTHNMQDASRKGRLWEQKKTNCPRGHEYSPENTCIWGTGSERNHRKCRECERVRSRLRTMKQQEMNSDAS